MSRRLALVTGASSGIGAVFAETLASRDHDVVLVARRRERLATLAELLEKEHGIKAHVLPADLAAPSAGEQIFAQLGELGLSPDVLVNNAGYSLPKAYEATTWSEQSAFLQVLLTAVAELTHRALPAMIERGYGRIIHVSSMAALLPGMPGATLYGASKSFLVSFGESLSAELQGTGVNVAVTCPGYTMSEFHDVAGTRAGVSSMPGFMWQDVNEVVNRALDAADEGRVVVAFGTAYRAILFLRRLLPLRMQHALLARFSRKYRRARGA